MAELVTNEDQNPKDMALTIKCRYGAIALETDRDNDVMIMLEDRDGSPATYLNVREATQLRDFITKWLEALTALLEGQKP